jgi:hypothetical protein
VETDLVDREPRCYLSWVWDIMSSLAHSWKDARARALQHREKVFRKEPLPSPRRHTCGTQQTRERGETRLIRNRLNGTRSRDRGEVVAGESRT